MGERIQLYLISNFKRNWFSNNCMKMNIENVNKLK